MMHINQLPAKCLEHLFVRLKYSLPQLLALRVICIRWCSVIERTIGHKTKSIKLFGSLDDLETFKTETSKLELKGLQNSGEILLINLQALRLVKFCDLLCRLFPRLDSLTIYLQFEVRFYKLPYLLSKLSSVSSLSLFGAIDQFLQVDNFSLELCSAIEENLHCLKHLNLHVRNLHRFSDFRVGYPAIQMRNILRHKLESFSLGHYQGDLNKVLAQLGPNCQQLSFGEGVDQLNGQIISKLTLEFQPFSSSDSDLVKHVSKNFVHLPSLEMTLKQPISVNVNKLSPVLTCIFRIEDVNFSDH